MLNASMTWQLCHRVCGTLGMKYCQRNYVFDHIEFVLILKISAEMTQVLDSIAWVHCASGNIYS